MAPLHTLHVEVNGQPQQRSVQPRQHLVDFIRNELGLKGSHLGCEHGVCGACTVEVDGRRLTRLKVPTPATGAAAVCAAAGIADPWCNRVA
jgi:aerobic-type carbon monoxide dehydrogenase small subunit (CoxS/CutS family)